ncbi:MAG TPA: ABC transporter permease [Kiloniellaceae bacterium]|nr:ABC transporter permease [Kiloniellaceae bacterium]
MVATTSATEAPLTTADGTPLKTSLRRAQRRNKIRAFLLVLPLLTFLGITFLVPIFDMIFRSVENEIVGDVLYRTVPMLQQWDETSGELPPDEVYQALVQDILEGKENNTIGKVGTRLNYELSGMSSAFRSAPRKMGKITEPPYKDAVIKTNDAWGDIDTWKLIKRESGRFTPSYFLAAIDMTQDPNGAIVSQPENRQIYVKLFVRTLWLSALITFLCLVLGYPISFILATVPTRTSNLLMILVLLPFWTSLLVRTTAWIALLQQEGVINDLLVWTGLVGDNNRLELVHNQIGTVVAMTHILLPFMVLPLFSVMKTIPPSYMRAARSLGANPFLAFVRIYVPQTVPGIGAGGILCFIIAIGYYITPALVGGTTGTLISNFIAYHMSVSLNWGLAAALGAILLGLVLVLYLLYDKIVGIDNMKLG